MWYVAYLVAVYLVVGLCILGFLSGISQVPNP